MPSTRDPILLLEPSNLLEPLDLADRHVDPAAASTRSDRDVTSATSSMRAQSAAAAICGPDAPRGARSPLSWDGSQPIRRDSLSAPTERESRWRLKSALLVMGALACVATGTALPQLAELPFGDVPSSQQTKSAQQQKAESIQRTIAETTSRPAPVARQPAAVADAPAKSEESNQSVALPANPGTRPTVADQPAPATPQPAQDAAAGPAKPCGPRNKASDDKCLEGGLSEPGGTARAVVPDRNSDGTTTASRPTGVSPAKSRAVPQSIWDLDERPQQSVNRRATQPISRPAPTTMDKAQGLPTGILLTGIGIVIADRIRTRIAHRAGAAIAPETTARLPDMVTAGRSRRSTDHRTGVVTAMTTTPAPRTVASSAELRMRTTA
jgi:hypothetical protein